MIAIAVPIFEPDPKAEPNADPAADSVRPASAAMDSTAKPKRVIGILARTAHLGQLLTEYGESIKSKNRLISLADQRNWQLLDHPWMTPEHMGQLLGESKTRATKDPRHPDPTSPAAALVKLQLSDTAKSRLGQSRRSPGGGTVDRDAFYTDPVSQLDPEGYGGVWLAAFADVGDTGWTVIVQERKASALAPVGDLRSETIRYGVIALVVSCALIGLLWYFVLRAINDRVLRIGPWRADGFRTETGSGLSTVSQR
jgi:hypothetical protein